MNIAVEVPLHRWISPRWPTSTDMVHMLMKAGAQINKQLGPVESKFPAVIAFGSVNVKMLAMVLKWNVDPTGCFGCNCTETASNHQYKLIMDPSYDDQAEQTAIAGVGTKFCEYITSPNRRQSLGYCLRLLLEYCPGTPKLCNRLKTAVEGEKEFAEIQFMLSRPRKLQEIARFAIRKNLVGDDLTKMVPIKDIELIESYGDYEEYVKARKVHVKELDTFGLPEKIASYLNFDYIET